jgi:hypothetical protein
VLRSNHLSETLILFLSPNTILKTLRESATRLDEPAYPRRVRDPEMDEFWSFVGAKRKQRWTWYGYDRQRRKVVAHLISYLYRGAARTQLCRQTYTMGVRKFPLFLI